MNNSGKGRLSDVCFVLVCVSFVLVFVEFSDSGQKSENLQFAIVASGMLTAIAYGFLWKRARTKINLFLMFTYFALSLQMLAQVIYM
jgi:Na+/proline symporter